jgi:ADP-heptose:LPS heptosyltransferase
MPEQLMLTNRQCPGDFIVMTAAIRDLALCYPGRYKIHVNVDQKDVLVANPHIAPMATVMRPKTVEAGYDKGRYSVNNSNQNRAHFLWGFISELNLKLKLAIRLTEFRPALYLTDDERNRRPIEEPYWVFVSGGKMDYTAKWWDPARWQQVINQMAPRVKMVQVGGTGRGSHIHKPMDNVIDLVGKTSFRQLINLIYHSEGVMCIVTCLMHIAAAFNKPCVVISGGREPWWWEAYNTENRLVNMRLGDPTWNPPANDNFIPHQYLHTLGQLPCCQNFGCWKSKILPPEVPPPPKHTKCAIPTKLDSGLWLPECLNRITVDQVVQAAEWYYNKGILKWGKPSSIFVPPVELLQPVTLPEPPQPVAPPVTIQFKEPPKEPVFLDGTWTVCGITSLQSPTRRKFALDLKAWCVNRKVNYLVIQMGAEKAMTNEMAAFGIPYQECSGTWVSAMMQAMVFAQSQPSERVILIEDPLHLNGKLDDVVPNEPFVAGTISWRPLTQPHLDRLAPILDPERLDKHPLAPGRFKAYYLNRGFVMGTKDILCKTLQNVHQREEYADILMCEYPRQHGAKVLDISEQFI